MSTHTNFGAKTPSPPPGRRMPKEGADRLATGTPKLKTVEVVGEGRVAVTRVGVPRIFRLLLALTGVKI